MANLNFISTNSVPGISQQAVAQDAALRRADDQEMRVRNDYDTKIRGAKALNDAVNSVQAKMTAPPVQTQAPGPVAPQEGPPIPSDIAAARPAPSPIYSVSTQPQIPQQGLSRQDLIRAMGNDQSTAPQRLQMMQQGVAHDEQLAMQNRQTANKAADHVWELAKTNDPASIAQARTLAQQYGINVPDQFWTDKQMRARTLGMVDTLHKSGLRGDQVPEFFRGLQNAGGNSDDEKFNSAMASIKPGLAWRQNIGGASGSNGVQRSFSSGGSMWALMKDGTTRQLTKPDGTPLKSNEADKFKGQVYLKGLGNAMIDDPMAVANTASSQVFPEPKASPLPQKAQSLPAGIPQGAVQVGTKGGVPVYERTDAQGNRKRFLAQ